MMHAFDARRRLHSRDICVEKETDGTRGVEAGPVVNKR